MPYRTFDKVRQVDQAAIVENKRLGPVLAYIAEAAEAARRQPQPEGPASARPRCEPVQDGLKIPKRPEHSGARPLRNPGQLGVRAPSSPVLVVTFLMSADCELKPVPTGRAFR